MKSKIVVGMVRERLTVVGKAEKSDSKKRTYWHCQCACGGSTMVRSDAFLDGRTNKSCGCYLIERNSVPKHGQSRTRTYHCWSMMKQRCFNPNTKGFYNYGGRGITVSPEWLSFEQFYADMGDQPEGLTLERRDNNGPYCKSNCEWVTQSQQMRNRRVTVHLDIDGVDTLLTDYCKTVGRTSKAVYMDLYRGKLKRFNNLELK